MQVTFTTTLVCALSCFACSGLGTDGSGEHPDPPGEELSAETNGRKPDTHWAAQTAAAVTAASGVVVSFTFDDTFSSQLDAASVLEAHDLTATLYVNSPRLHQAQAGADNSTYMSLAEARELALRGHEIGGHTTCAAASSENAYEKENYNQI